MNFSGVDYLANQKGEFIGKSVIDPFTGGIRTINEIVSALYEGRVYKVSGVTLSIVDGTDDDITILTPDTPTLIEIIGLILLGEGSPWKVELYEAPTLTPGVEASKQFVNMNRLSGENTDIKVYDAPTITVDGTFLDEAIFGGIVGQGNQKGSFDGGNFFFGWLLAPNTYYNIRITNNTGGDADIGADLFIKEMLNPTI